MQLLVAMVLKTKEWWLQQQVMYFITMEHHLGNFTKVNCLSGTKLGTLNTLFGWLCCGQNCWLLSTWIVQGYYRLITRCFSSIAHPASGIINISFQLYILHDLKITHLSSNHFKSCISLPISCCNIFYFYIFYDFTGSNGGRPECIVL